MEADRVLLMDLAAQILDVERSPSELRAEQQERLDAYKYPVLTLSNEVISEIFVHFLPVYPSATGLASPTTLTCLPPMARSGANRSCAMASHSGELPGPLYA
ncbi:F-box domain-containing protein [Mycena sanguinolenta]|uniref:F-box domain-containing protein n=1 Tax=Mycena sanguinolenta TaxID=230812 RepID=A0A8H6ZG17_9AGAR|nr:F-box domain-containing protein [Mycena sanguinolenta]